jgi:hypothetical protein
VQRAHERPDQRKQPQRHQGVIDPQHLERMFAEHVFARTGVLRHRGVTILCLALLLSAACLANPQRTQSVDLLNRLAAARTQLQQNPPPAQACTDVGDVETRLYGEPGLVEMQPTWSQLANAAHALHAVCGQTALLAQPISGSPALEAARADWLSGIQRELDVACDHLRAAATSLERAAPC